MVSPRKSWAKVVIFLCKFKSKYYRADSLTVKPAHSVDVGSNPTRSLNKGKKYMSIPRIYLVNDEDYVAAYSIKEVLEWAESYVTDDVKTVRAISLQEAFETLIFDEYENDYITLIEELAILYRKGIDLPCFISSIDEEEFEDDEELEPIILPELSQTDT